MRFILPYDVSATLNCTNNTIYPTMNIPTHITMQKAGSSRKKQSFARLMDIHGIKRAGEFRFVIALGPVNYEKRLHQVAARDKVVDGWILRLTDEYFVCLNLFSEVWTKLQEFTRKQNFCVAQGFTSLLRRTSLQHSVSMTPVQIPGLQLIWEQNVSSGFDVSMEAAAAYQYATELCC